MKWMNFFLMLLSVLIITSIYPRTNVFAQVLPQNQIQTKETANPDSTCFLTSNTDPEVRVQSQLQTDLFKHLSDTSNQESVLQTAISRNKGDYHNACVYFGSEALRRIGVTQSALPIYTSTISQFTDDLNNMGWKTSSDYKQLLPGDICFTTDENLNNGVPTHTYVFMKWVTAAKYDFAYVCDNQAPQYNNQVNHVRNIENALYTSSGKKEPFLFFMYK